jgi:hypothetical protein
MSRNPEPVNPPWLTGEDGRTVAEAAAIAVRRESQPDPTDAFNRARRKAVKNDDLWHQLDHAPSRHRII